MTNDKKVQSLSVLLGIGLNISFTWNSALWRIILAIFLEKILWRGGKKEKKGRNRKEKASGLGERKTNCVQSRI